MLDKHKPIPERLSDWGDGREILYRCCACNASLGFYGHKQQYCHMCGNKIDWSKSPEKCSKEFKEKYDNLYKEYREHLDYCLYSQQRIKLLYKLYTNEEI